MPTIIVATLGRFAPWLLAALLVIGGVIYIRHQQTDLRTARGDAAADTAVIGQLTAVNAQNLASLKRLQVDAAAWQAAEARAASTDSQDTALADTLVSSAAATAPANDAPIAPVMASTLAAIAKAQMSTIKATMEAAP